MFCDLWPYILWPLDFIIQKRIVSDETIWGNTVSKLFSLYILRKYPSIEIPLLRKGWHLKKINLWSIQKNQIYLSRDLYNKIEISRCQFDHSVINLASILRIWSAKKFVKYHFFLPVGTLNSFRIDTHKFQSID